MARLLVAAVLILALPIAPARGQDAYDVVVYGGSPAAVTAAVQARRLGKTTVILVPGRRLGGLSSAGVGAAHYGDKAAVGGLARQFYERVHQHYAQPAAWRDEQRQDFLARSARRAPDPDALADRRGLRAMWTAEPRVAESIFRDMAADARVPVHYGERLDLAAGVSKQRARVAAIRMESGRVYRGKVFIDASYECDLMAKAGVSYRTGRDANEPASAIVPADGVRLVMSEVPANQGVLTPPPGYDRSRFEPVLARPGLSALLPRIASMPNRKVEIDPRPVFPVAGPAYAEADHALRPRLLAEQVNALRGLWWFLQTDAAVPAAIAQQARRFAPCKDELVEGGGWPDMIDMGNTRRALADFVVTDRHLSGLEAAGDGIGLVAMPRTDAARVTAHAIPFGAIVPREQEAANLLVPVCPSATRAAQTALRAEPVLMILGQSAAVAASLAIDAGAPIQRVNYAKLRARLVYEEQALEPAR